MTNISDQEWDKFISQFNGVHLLQTSSWGAFKSKFGWRVSRVITDKAGVQILFKRLPFGFTWAYIPKGPVGDKWDELWPFVDKVCHQKKAVFLKIEPDFWEREKPNISSELVSQGFLHSNHHIQPVRTFVINIDSPEDSILSMMKQKTRYNIRLAAKKGIQVNSSSDVWRFYNLIQVTGDRDAFEVHSLEYYQSVFNLFSERGECELLFAEYDGKLLAAIMVFAFGGRAWYFYGASSNQHRNLMAPYAAQWSAIRWAMNKGCGEFDLWGVPDEEFEYLESEFTNRNDGLWGVYRFKRGFGGELYRTAGTWDRIYNKPIYKLYQFWIQRNL